MVNYYRHIENFIKNFMATHFAANAYIFRDVLDSCTVDKKYAETPLSSTRKETVKMASLQRNDELHSQLDSLLLDYHVLCYSAYTSKERIER